MLALLCSTVVNIVNSLYAKKGEKPKLVDPTSFIPKWHDPSKKEEELVPVEQTVDEQRQSILDIFTAFGVKKRPKLKPPPISGVKNGSR